MNLMRFHLYMIERDRGQASVFGSPRVQIGRLFASTNDEAVARSLAINRSDVILVDTHEE